MKTLNAPGDLNIARVLRLIWQTTGISRIEIAQQLGIDKSTVTKIVTSLEEIGIIRAFAQGNAGPQGGRKPIHLEISPNFGLAVGIEMNTDGVVVTAVDLHGVIRASVEEKMEVTSVFVAFDIALNRIRNLIDELGLPILAVGVGVPAIVNTETGTIIQSIPLMISEELPFCHWASDTYGLPVYIENDARCGCLGEIIRRHGKDLENALFLLSEIRKITGDRESRKNLSVGFGFILKGEAFYGKNFAAGEFRSLLWEPGNSGQFQSNDIAGERFGSDQSVTGTVIGELARHVALISNLLSLDHVFLGGLPNDLTLRLAEEIKREIALKWPYSLPRVCEIRQANLGPRAVAYGAAGHCIMRFFALPNIHHPSGGGPSIKETLSSIKQD